MDFSPAALNKRHAEINKKREAILAKSTPLREKRDEMVAKHLAARETADAAITDAEDGLYELDQERAMIVRALGTRLGAE